MTALGQPPDSRDAVPVAAFENGGDVCQGCGACCSYSSSWPRFSLETEAELARLPEHLVSLDGSGMRCDGNRCLALSGAIGERTGCTVYAVRPQVCRSCMPGDDACRMARAHFRLYELPRLTTPTPETES